MLQQKQINKQMSNFVPVLHCWAATAESYLYHLHSTGINPKKLPSKNPTL